MDADTLQEATGRPADAGCDDTIQATEQWFVRQGVPHFIVDYTVTEKVLPRTVPVLTLSFLVSVFVVVNRTWPLWRNAVAVAGAFLVLVGIWAIANRVRGMPARRVPETVGFVEVSVYLFAPAALALWTRSLRTAGLTILAHAIQLVFIYYSTSYGLVPMTAWNLRRVVAHLDLGFRLVGRTFPILLLAVTFLLFNSPSWKTIAVTPLPRYVALLGLFVGITLLFVYQSVVSEFEVLGSFDSPDELRELCENSPLAEVAPPSPVDTPTTPTLSRRERANLLLMAIYSAWGYLMLLMLFVLAFFVLFGLLAIPADVVSDLVGRPVDSILTVTALGASISLTSELVRIAGFIAVFTGLYLTVHAVNDQAIRNELDGSIRAHIREVLAVREVYKRFKTSASGLDPEAVHRTYVDETESRSSGEATCNRDRGTNRDRP